MTSQGLSRDTQAILSLQNKSGLIQNQKLIQHLGARRPRQGRKFPEIRESKDCRDAPSTGTRLKWGNFKMTARGHSRNPHLPTSDAQRPVLSSRQGKIHSSSHPEYTQAHSTGKGVWEMPLPGFVALSTGENLEGLLWSQLSSSPCTGEHFSSVSQSIQ